MLTLERILAIPDSQPDFVQMGIAGKERAALAARGFVRKDGIKAKDYMIRTIQKTEKSKDKAIIKGDKPLSNTNGTFLSSNPRNAERQDSMKKDMEVLKNTKFKYDQGQKATVVTGSGDRAKKEEVGILDSYVQDGQVRYTVYPKGKKSSVGSHFWVKESDLNPIASTKKQSSPTAKQSTRDRQAAQRAAAAPNKTSTQQTPLPLTAKAMKAMERGESVSDFDTYSVHKEGNKYRVTNPQNFDDEGKLVDKEGLKQHMKALDAAPKAVKNSSYMNPPIPMSNNPNEVIRALRNGRLVGDAKQGYEIQEHPTRKGDYLVTTMTNKKGNYDGEMSKPELVAFVKSGADASRFNKDVKQSSRGMAVTYNKKGDLSSAATAAKAKKAISGQAKGGKVVKGVKPSDRGAKASKAYELLQYSLKADRGNPKNLVLALDAALFNTQKELREKGKTREKSSNPDTEIAVRISTEKARQNSFQRLKDDAIKGREDPKSPYSIISPTDFNNYVSKVDSVIDDSLKKQSSYIAAQKKRKQDSSPMGRLDQLVKLGNESQPKQPSAVAKKLGISAEKEADILKRLKKY